MIATSIRSYRDLHSWHKAMDLVEACYRATDGFPPAERYGLVSQIRRAAVSIPSNIAEGHARTTGDYIRFLSIAAGSLSELETQLILSGRLRHLNDDQVSALLERCNTVGRMLATLRKRLSAKRAPKPRVPSP